MAAKEKWAAWYGTALDQLTRNKTYFNVPGASWKPTDLGIYQLRSYAILLRSEEDAEVYYYIPRQSTAKTGDEAAQADAMEADIAPEGGDDEDMRYAEWERRTGKSCDGPATR